MSDRKEVLVRPVKPKPESWLTTPFLWSEWVMEWVVYGFGRLAFFQILEYAAKLTILIALILYVLETPDRRRRAEIDAWQIINSAENQPGSSGRVEAIEYLNKSGVDLTKLTVDNAYLVGITKDGRTRGINLSNGRLVEANFQNTILFTANFKDANLVRANLTGAVLTGANLLTVNLEGANLEGANLEGANLTGADLLIANLKGANLLTANLKGANLAAANLAAANLAAAINLTITKLCRAETLYSAKLDLELFEGVKQKCPQLLEEPKGEE